MNQLIKNLFLLSLCLLNQTFGDVQSASNHRDFSPRLLASTALMKEYNNNADSDERTPIASNMNSNEDDETPASNDEESIEASNYNNNNQQQQQNELGEVQKKYKALLRMLEDHSTGQSVPVVLMNADDNESDPAEGMETFNENKRSGRYYQRYPWKRQNTRYRSSRTQSQYEADMRYLCVPSREEVLSLIVGLHESRNGIERTVNFCNRKRPAKAIFTNIRFLGK